ncbi:hypothetical protein BaRGS_00039273, partial [Batillaria attramentaria]
MVFSESDAVLPVLLPTMGAAHLCRGRSLLVVVLLMSTPITSGLEPPAVTGSGVFVVGEERTLTCAITTTETSRDGQFPLTWTKESDPNTAIPAKETTVVACEPQEVSELTLPVSPILSPEPPDTPVITGPASVEIGQESAWTCKVDGASSPPNVYWQFGNGTPIVTGVTSLGTNIYLDTDTGGYIGKEA